MHWTVCFKDCRYGPDETPALDQYPVAVGRPEYAIYARATGRLPAFLPEVYHSEEVQRGQKYRYLLQDLRGPYHKPTSPQDLYTAVSLLWGVEDALREWALQTCEPDLVRYDLSFMRTVAAYVDRALDRYAMKSTEGIGFKPAALTKMLELLAGAEFHDYMPPSGVHGDCNPASLLLMTSGRQQLKVVDWEWAGMGIPHFDLAILLEGTDDVFTQDALALYARQRPALSLAEHRRLFHWSRMSTCMLKAAVLAEELNCGSPAPRADRAAYLQRFLQMSAKASQRL